MNLTKKLSDAFNEQIKAEMESSNLYLQMAVYFKDLGLSGCAHWMMKQTGEETEHAHKLIDYSVMRGGTVTIGTIDAVPNKWDSPEAVFEQVYKHECYVSELIDKLMDIAIAENDKATQDFLWWFVREQVEEEDTAKSILDKFKIYGVHGLYSIDHELGKRD
ncbi:ferritin [Parabacteroides sp. PF5-5]|uniref:ferritin n=1 Tax=unclassified Parabacteroides TaxID=2649774 RepID=UPI002473C4E7|nr:MULTISPECIES: ferritin [unclassified Parabacteroides]MDH6304183.1 ferritin [Parabacteroides sp. PH5-39]MDH6315101.1 ferritin [Parabacteroides sp. PF5-13]MDH6318762.1 ferritin [Parabacteroides sp. PH5-13]MDH6322491.1 ferritin [Parabacteroides sp. PH5-8]MDH6326373.1 ferritin [Parabacteroides sp. PH5-41]